MWRRVLIVLSSILLSSNCESVCKLPNTGTVLFRGVDVNRRHCWSREELALLYTRRAMMELVPRQIPHNIPLILEYVTMCMDTLREIATSKEVYEYMLAAFADTFGGYLQTYGLPLLHEAYYEGYVSYDTAAEFHRLQDSLKAILRSNGVGWAKSMEVRKHINKILPLKLRSSITRKPCNLLVPDDTCSKGKEGDQEIKKNKSMNLSIALPILDDNKRPNSIAIPFKNRPLFSIKSRTSYDILIKYYIEASRCIGQSKRSDQQQEEFDRVFLAWLKSKVEPRLKDEDWYVGFSNVLRIAETIQQKGGMIGPSSSNETREEPLFSEPESGTQFRTFYIFLILGLLLFVLFIYCLYCSLVKSCMHCDCLDVEKKDRSRAGSDAGTDPSDQSALLTSSEDTSTHLSERGKEEYSESSQSFIEQSRIRLSCGTGKGYGHKNRQRQ